MRISHVGRSEKLNRSSLTDFLSKGQSQLLVLLRLLQFLEQQARLNVLIVLVLAAVAVLANRPFDRVIENLADRQSGVDADRVNGA